MPEEGPIERAREDEREGLSPSTQAGEFVREEMEHIREGEHGARSPEQAIAIGLSKARRAGVKLPPPKRGKTRTKRQAKRDLAKGRRPKNHLEDGHVRYVVHSNAKAAGLHRGEHYRSRPSVRRVAVRRLRALLPQKRLRKRENAVGARDAQGKEASAAPAPEAAAGSRIQNETAAEGGGRKSARQRETARQSRHHHWWRQRNRSRGGDRICQRRRRRGRRLFGGAQRCEGNAAARRKRREANACSLMAMSAMRNFVRRPSPRLNNGSAGSTSWSIMQRSNICRIRLRKLRHNSSSERFGRIFSLFSS